MRRRLRHALIITLLVAAGAAMLNHRLENAKRREIRDVLPDTARARRTLVLDTEKWTTFRIPSTATRIKVLSRANFADSAETLVDQQFPYEIEYQLESLDGKTIAQGTYALTAHLVPMVDSAGTPRKAAFLHASNLTSAPAKASTLELASGGVSVLKLRARPFAEPIVNVSVRTFLRQQVSKRKLDYKWTRLRPASRERIGERRIHSLVDLTRDEKRSILQNRWVPLGAQGIAGTDYQEDMLYLRDDLVAATRLLVEPLGVGEIRCAENRRAIIGIPDPGGRIRLEFRRLAVDAAPAQIRFFGETIQERSTHVHSLDGRISEFSATFPPGMLEIESPVDAAVRPFWTAEGKGEQLLELDPLFVRTWRAGGEDAITFQIGGNRDDSDFFRISVRPIAPAAATLRFEFIGANGTVVTAGEREIACVPSIYDVLRTPEGESPANDPVQLILQSPAGVTAIRLRADADVLLNGYTRPASLPHRTRVPSDYVRALPDPERLPVWFGLRPDDADNLIRSHRSFLIRIQTRPPEDDLNIIAGKYQWEDFQPGEGALGQYLLSDRDPDSPSRDEALPALFMPIPVGEEQPLSLANPPGLDLPSRRLAFVRSGREASPLKILIDGAAFFERDLVTARGELLLPPILPDSRTILIESPAEGLQCYLNYVLPDKATKIKRLAQRISPEKSFVFLCDKTTDEDELMTGMLFAPCGTEQEAKIHISIRPGENGGFLPVAESFTLRERIYHVTPDPDKQTPVLGGKNATVDGGRRFFIPLGHDLRAGTYEVTITMQEGSDGYLTLSKLTGGDFSDARFFLEASR